jgi:hypothetical protein
VYLVIGLLFWLGAYEIITTIRVVYRWRKKASQCYVPAPRVQFAAWLALLVVAVCTWVRVGSWLAGVFLLAAQILPRQRKRRGTDTEGETTAEPLPAGE